MRAFEQMSTDFRLVDADWSSDVAHEVVKRSGAKFIAVRQQQASDLAYYVFQRAELMKLCEEEDFDLQMLLQRAKHRALPIIAGDANAARSRKAQVVISRRGPAGVIMPTHWARAAGHASLGDLVAAEALATVSTTPELVTRYVSAELPANIVVGTRAELSVTISAADDQPAGLALPLDLALGTKLDVIVEASGGLVLERDDVITFEIVEPQPTATLTLGLKAEAEGAGRIKARIYRNGDFVTSFTLKATLTGAAAKDKKETARQAIILEPAPHARPDLSLLIFETNEGLTFRVQDKDDEMHMVNHGTVALPSDQHGYFRSFFSDIEKLPLDTEQQRKDAQYHLQRKGAFLFEKLLPEELRTLLWSLRERIASVRITSDQPWIPWELCRLTGNEAGLTEEGKFLAEYAVTRWLDRKNGAPLELRLDEIALVVPEDSGLQHAPNERAFMLALAEQAGLKVTAVPATLAAVSGEMEQGKHTAWHFTGHARASQNKDANQATIELCDRQPLRAEDIAGRPLNMLRSKPIIFFNACQSAQAGLSLTGVGGWADRFIGGKQTAGAFIGSYWAIDDEVAYCFARAFYTGLLSGKPIGEAARDARQEIRRSDDPTWLAYTVYAHPSARLRLGAPG